MPARSPFDRTISRGSRRPPSPGLASPARSSRRRRSRGLSVFENVLVGMHTAYRAGLGAVLAAHAAPRGVKSARWLTRGRASSRAVRARGRSPTRMRAISRSASCASSRSPAPSAMRPTHPAARRAGGRPQRRRARTPRRSHPPLPLGWHWHTARGSRRAVRVRAVRSDDGDEFRLGHRVGRSRDRASAIPPCARPISARTPTTGDRT